MEQMPSPVLRTAIGSYGHTTALKDGTITSPMFDLEHIEVSPVPMIFRRMVRGLEFDVAEMALATCLCARAHGRRFTAIPIFLTRAFYHGELLYHRRSGIREPKDLAAPLAAQHAAPTRHRGRQSEPQEAQRFSRAGVHRVRSRTRPASTTASLPSIFDSISSRRRNDVSNLSMKEVVA